eukprot:TRINITY_DN80712_c0_g1_i1.p1 TRINITY_DN80712_c0_g1~~TRINITY_DN80712_c0_g1_i1.p1  ORF type:complete len:218 (+),score=33.47 TRINITY_DN80712_c0_g1_i1:31-684(+)
MALRVVVVSDTHNGHDKLDVPDGDILVHCGDLTNRGSAPELTAVNTWLGKLPHQHKIVVCGNMDKRLESQPSREARARWLSSAVYLEDETLEVEGLRFYGSPFTPKFCGAFQLDGAAEAAEKWASVPDDLDILITHGPPHGILDCVGRGQHAGCPELMKRVRSARPRFHLFGHIHEEGGRKVVENDTTFVNAAQHVMVLEIEPPEPKGSAPKCARKE